MRKFYFLTVLMVLLLATTVGIKAQTCTINMGNVDPAYVEQFVSVPIYVHDFKNVGAFQLQVNFSTTNLELAEDPTYTFNGVSVFATALAQANNNGALVLQWNYTGTPGGELTLSDGTLMTLKFYVKLGATLGSSPITISNGALVVNNAATSLLLGKTDGSVKIAAALSPTIKMQLKAGNSSVLQLYCQNFISYAGFEVTVNYPAATYPGVTTGGITFPNAGITGVTTAIKTNQVFMSWAYSGQLQDAVTLGTNGTGVLAEIDFGTPITLTDVTLGTKIANTVANQEKVMSLTQQITTATASLGTVVNAPKGSVVTIPLNVTNFSNVGAFQFTINFPTAQLELAEDPVFTSGGQSIISNTLSQVNASGNLILQWNYSGVAGQELNQPDGTLLNLKFLATGTAPNSAALTFTQSLVVNPSAANILQTGYPGGGAIVFQSQATPGFTLGTGTVGAGNKVTIPLTVTNLTAVAGMTLHITVPANFTIAGTDITASSDWTAASLGAPTTGVVGTDARIIWAYDGNLSHLATLADGTTIANLVFTYTGPVTTATIPVSFASAITNDVSNVEAVAGKTSGSINVVASITQTVKVFLQGPFSGSTMSTALATATLVPLAQPYTGAPWSYAGTETVANTGVFTTNSIVDWVLVELRTTASGAAVERKAALLKNDGTIVGVDGTTAGVVFTSAAGSYFIVIKHRNHLTVMSAAAVALGTAYDFTTAQAQAYGTNPMAVLGSSFGMIAGDANASGIVTAADISAVISALNAITYINADANLSGITTAADISVMISNLNLNTQVP